MKLDRELKIVLSITAVLGVVVPIIMYVGALIFPFCSSCYLLNSDFSGATLNQWSVFRTWDAYHYLYLATHWYAPGIIQNAFYPLWPALLRFGDVLFFKQTLLTGFILSNLFLLGTVALLYSIVKSEFEKRVAFVACLFLLAFPTGFFFHLPYTESLFLFLVLLLFYGLNKKNIVLVCLAGLLLPLARPQGLFVLVPTLYYLWTNRAHFHLSQFYAVFMSFAFGFLAYLFIMKLSAGSELAGFVAQGFFKSNNSSDFFFHPLRWLVDNMFQIQNLAFHSPGNSVVDRLFFVLFIPLLIGIYRYLPKVYFVYALAVGLLPALFGNLMSFPRYLIVIFPLYVVLALRFHKHYLWLVLPMGVLQLLLLVIHSLGYWVA